MRLEEDGEKERELSPLLLIIFALILFIIGVCLLVYFVGSWNAEKQVEQLRISYVTTEPLDTAKQDGRDATDVGAQSAGDGQDNGLGTDSVVIDGVEYPDFTGLEVPDRDVDFKGLQSDVSKDIYAWIYIPNTNVDYPVLQHSTESEFYLTHNMYGNKASEGSIFTQYYNHKDFNDNHTVIYGHNMKNGSMFKTLHYYMEESFFEENPYIYLYLEKETRVYRIFAAYEYSDEHLLLSYDMEDSTVYEAYLEKIESFSDSAGYFDREVELTATDKIITLSTCIGGKSDKRYLVQAKLVAVEMRDET